MNVQEKLNKTRDLCGLKPINAKLYLTLFLLSSEDNR